jgi:hypothetical protein
MGFAMLQTHDDTLLFLELGGVEEEAPAVPLDYTSVTMRAARKQHSRQQSNSTTTTTTSKAWDHYCCLLLLQPDKSSPPLSACSATKYSQSLLTVASSVLSTTFRFHLDNPSSLS